MIIDKPYLTIFIIEIILKTKKKVLHHQQINFRQAIGGSKLIIVVEISKYIIYRKRPRKLYRFRCTAEQN